MKKTSFNSLIGFVLAMALLVAVPINAQEYFPKNDGVKTKNENYTAFTNATIYVSPSRVIDKGTLLIKNGKVVASGTAVSIPKNALTIDLDGKYIYPSFIDLYTDFGTRTTQVERHITQTDAFAQRGRHGPAGNRSNYCAVLVYDIVALSWNAPFC